MRPLEGLTVLDFSQAYSGPYCAMNLADYGARIIKVERVEGGDQSRFWNPYADNGKSGYFAIYNRNKEGIALDLSEQEGKDIIKKLFAEVDVVLENFKFGTMDKLGIGYDVAKEINPEIIFASLSGFGQTGPLCKNTAYDNVIECMSGFMEMTGFPENPPLRSGASVGDSYTGLMTALAIALAYYDKKHTGKGRRIDVAMLDTMFAAIEDAVLAYSLTGEPITRSGNAKPHEIVPYDTYHCAGDEVIAVGITEESMWPDFCKAIDMPELVDDPRFATNDLRCENYQEFTEIMAEYVADKNIDDLLEAFSENKIPASGIFAPLEAMDHPQIRARDMIISIDDPNVGSFKGFGIPVKFSKTPGFVAKPSPELGEDSCRILETLGYSKEEIDRLVEEEIVGTPETTEKYFEED